MRFNRLENSLRASITRRWQVRQRKPISAPTR